MEWGSGALAVACLAAAVLHVVRLVVVRRDRAAEASHAAMALGMAAMASPLGDPVPEPVWTSVFVLVAAWFAASVLRTRTVDGESVHHVVGSGAMLFMLAADHGAHGGPTPAFVPITAMALTGYFAWHALRCVDRCRHHPAHPAHCAEQPAGDGAVALSIRTPQAGAAGHLVGAVAMSAMLLTMV
ncbi:hypothetical protein BJF78_08475 [Pseudonocardia sp. CNS-139]|nr:hypothetical protein BJF78_08475 [Pseudonocardia sp. CNS-139]